MKQIAVISGKGGTGKTVIAASFAALAENKIMVDCDVDASNLHLLLTPAIKEKHSFKSGFTAIIDKDKCTECGKCIEICRFEAIGADYRVDPISCEGCAFCSFVCPVHAINMEENLSGEWFISETRYGPMVHAKLGIAEENSGKLVSLVKQKAKELAEKQNFDLIIIDGSPGIGCPVIASLSGVNYAVVVTEPTLSGLHDADRVIQVAAHFEVPVKLIVNKYDLNIEITEEIERYCKDKDIDIIGKIPFDDSIVKAMVEGKTIIEYDSCKSEKEIRRIWESLEENL